MKKAYISPETEIVILSENDVLAFSATSVTDGKFTIFDWSALTGIDV